MGSALCSQWYLSQGKLWNNAAVSLHFGILKGVLMSNSFYYFDVFLRHLPSYVTDGELRKLVTPTTVLFCSLYEFWLCQGWWKFKFWRTCFTFKELFFLWDYCITMSFLPPCSATKPSHIPLILPLKFTTSFSLIIVIYIHTYTYILVILNTYTQLSLYCVYVCICVYVACVYVLRDDCIG